MSLVASCEYNSCFDRAKFGFFFFYFSNFCDLFWFWTLQSDQILPWKQLKLANFWKSNFTKLQISLDFLYGLQKVDSAPKTRESDGSEFVHNLVFRFEYIEYIVLKDLAFLLVNLNFLDGRIFKKCQIQLENAIFSKNHYYHINYN